MDRVQQQINIELGEEESQGTYANVAFIVYSPAEIIMDFARIMPGIKKAKVQARIIMTPQNAKMLSKALQDNINKYEKQFGEIKLYGKESKNIGFQASSGTDSEATS